jgi:hypothetical protein
MPWRREEVAPYCYEDRYIPDTHEKFYYSWVERTPQERDELYHRMNNIPYEDAPEPRSSVAEAEWVDMQRRSQPKAPPKKEEPKDDGKIHLMKPLQLQHKEAAGKAEKPKKQSRLKKASGGPRH